MRKMKLEERKVSITIMIDRDILSQVESARDKQRVSRSSWINTNLNNLLKMGGNKARQLS